MERRINPMSGMRVKMVGEVRDENGDIIGRLTAGDLGHCAVSRLTTTAML